MLPVPSEYLNWNHTSITFNVASLRSLAAFKWISDNVTEYKCVRNESTLIRIYVKDTKELALLILKFGDICERPR